MQNSKSAPKINFEFLRGKKKKKKQFQKRKKLKF